MTYRFDPELRDAAAVLPPLDLADVHATRTALANGAAQMPPFAAPSGIEIEKRDVFLDGRENALGLVVVTPRNLGGTRPCLVWFHGGGFVLGSPQLDIATTVSIAEASGAIVVSVDYRLAPENLYPAAMEDAYAALLWVVNNADQLDIDSDRVAVGGTSAGACLAAAVALKARDLQGPRICFQVLDSPVTDHRLISPSMQKFTDTPMWARESAKQSWAAYLGSTAPDQVEIYASPGIAEDLTGLPPAFISVCEFDPLRDEGLDYGRRLLEAGVTTELHLYAGTFHNSAHALSHTGVSQRMLHDLHDAITRALAIEPVDSDKSGGQNSTAPA